VAEHLSNRASALLNATIDGSQTSFVVTGTTGFPSPNFRVRVDNELMLVTGVAGTTFTVTRGIEGTVAIAHAAGIPVTVVLTAGGLIQYLTENYVHL
jgi:hypothetical protein